MKNFFMKISDWFSGRDIEEQASFRNSHTNNMLLCDHIQQGKNGTNAPVIVKKTAEMEKKEGTEKLNEAFNRLVDKLEGINANLKTQVGQHAELMKHVDRLPELIESLPGAVDNQRKMVESLIEQLKAVTQKDRQMAELIAKIPAETARQTAALAQMNTTLSEVAETDAQIGENFGRFNTTLSRFDEDLVSQTECIGQMQKTFTASDRYLKYIVTTQNRRFMIVFVAAMLVCVVAIVSLLAGLIMLLNRGA